MNFHVLILWLLVVTLYYETTPPLSPHERAYCTCLLFAERKQTRLDYLYKVMNLSCVGRLHLFAPVVYCLFHFGLCIWRSNDGRDETNNG